MDDVKDRSNWAKASQYEKQLPVTYKGQLSIYLGKPSVCRQQTRKGLAV